MKFLDSTGLGVLWNKIKSSFLSLNGGVITFNDIDASISLDKYSSNSPSIRMGIPYDESNYDGFIAYFDNDNAILKLGIEQGRLNCITLVGVN